MSRREVVVLACDLCATHGAGWWCGCFGRDTCAD